MKHEQGAWHIGGLLIIVLLIAAGLYFFGALQRLPQMEKQIEFLQRRMDVMQKQLDDIDLRQRVSDIRPEK